MARAPSSLLSRVEETLPFRVGKVLVGFREDLLQRRFFFVLFFLSLLLQARRLFVYLLGSC